MIKWLDRCLITSPIYYALCLDEKSFKQELKARKLAKEDWPAFIKNEYSNATTHFFVRNNTVTAIVCFKNNKFDLQQIHALLLHEAVHIWQDIKLQIGEHNPSQEFEAYAIQALAQNLFYAYKKMTKK